MFQSAICGIFNWIFFSRAFKQAQFDMFIGGTVDDERQHARGLFQFCASEMEKESVLHTIHYMVWALLVHHCVNVILLSSVDLFPNGLFHYLLLKCNLSVYFVEIIP